MINLVVRVVLTFCIKSEVVEEFDYMRWILMHQTLEKRERRQSFFKWKSRLWFKIIFTAHYKINSISSELQYPKNCKRSSKIGLHQHWELPGVTKAGICQTVETASWLESSKALTSKFYNRNVTKSITSTIVIWSYFWVSLENLAEKLYSHSVNKNT